jgi:hypothetical protein
MILGCLQMLRGKAPATSGYIPERVPTLLGRTGRQFGNKWRDGGDENALKFAMDV